MYREEEEEEEEEAAGDEDEEEREEEDDNNDDEEETTTIHVIVEQEFGAQGCGPPGKGGPSKIGAVLSKIVHDVHTHPLAQDPLLKRGSEAAHQLHWIYVGESIHAVVYIV
ncbi:hypothetical protein ALC57_14363 [Trachymyrmex cornetzi]|uniref:Uncharacterized protein n=1 Tax=Trachymyrmex cornetzi TaxID=471704 RepID=A0A195DKC6_9HYME|nr:hypothetical protein ALC57_14363 [Trachymyrmex cornetzi]